MAQFTTGIGQTDDLKKVQDYLYKLNKDLEYMFSHLTPEDNYSEPAYTKYIQDGEKVVQLETSVDGVKMMVKNNETNYNASLQVLAGLLNLSASTPAGQSSMVLSGDKITLSTGKFIVNSKNLSVDAQGNATFSGALNAASGTFAGDLQAAGGTFAGTLSAANIVSPQITGEMTVDCGDYFEVRDLGELDDYWIMLGTFSISYDTMRHQHVLSSTGNLRITDDGDIVCESIEIGGDDLRDWMDWVESELGA